jgi:hypothetical protein
MVEHILGEIANLKIAECAGRLSTLVVETLWQQPSEHSHPPDQPRVAAHAKSSVPVSALQHCAG